MEWLEYGKTIHAINTSLTAKGLGTKGGGGEKVTNTAFYTLAS